MPSLLALIRDRSITPILDPQALSRAASGRSSPGHVHSVGGGSAAGIQLNLCSSPLPAARPSSGSVVLAASGASSPLCLWPTAAAGALRSLPPVCLWVGRAPGPQRRASRCCVRPTGAANGGRPELQLGGAAPFSYLKGMGTEGTSSARVRVHVHACLSMRVGSPSQTFGPVLDLTG